MSQTNPALRREARKIQGAIIVWLSFFLGMFASGCDDVFQRSVFAVALAIWGIAVYPLQIRYNLLQRAGLTPTFSSILLMQVLAILLAWALFRWMVV